MQEPSKGGSKQEAPRILPLPRCVRESQASKRGAKSLVHTATAAHILYPHFVVLGRDVVLIECVLGG